MKITRYKRVQRYLNFYKNNFSFRAPFQILIDSTFCQSALKNKVNITEQMPKYLNDSVKLFTTVCVVEETQRLSSSLYGAMVVIKQFNVRKCGHEKSPIAANECLLSLIKQNNNSEHYLLATQDSYLSNCVRNLIACPIIYIKMNAIVMEKPNHLTQKFASNANEQQIELPVHEFKILKQLKRKELHQNEDEVKQTVKKRKGPKGPNPLSCKKKKKKVVNNSNNNQIIDSKECQKSKRKRYRNRVPKHIKKMFDRIETHLNQN